MSYHTIPDTDLISTLISRGEGHSVDFKLRLDCTDRKHLGGLIKDIHAFSNCHSDGTKYIIIGIDNDKNVEGADTIGIDEAHLRQKIQSELDTRVEWALHEVIYEGKNLIIFSIDKCHRRPVRFKKSFNYGTAEDTKELWQSQATIIRDGSSCRPWDRFDDEQLRSEFKPQSPLLSVKWTDGTISADAIFIDMMNTDNEIREEPRPQVNTVKSNLINRIIDEYKNSPSKVIDIELPQLDSKTAAFMDSLENINRMQSKLSHLIPDSNKPFEEPKRKYSEVDIEVEIGNSGTAKAGEFDLILNAPAGCRFAKYWNDYLRVGSINRDFDISDDSTDTVSLLRRQGLRQDRQFTAKVRIRFDGPGTYEFRWNSSVENLPQSVEGSLYLTVE
ncbi:MAG: ATP-binding protein [Fimbriimonadaceae bacterium]|nr:ATP-binding protein [Fimbriimonadaceae bacterium]